jgi:hypothetical protein
MPHFADVFVDSCVRLHHELPTLLDIIKNHDVKHCLPFLSIPLGALAESDDLSGRAKTGKI